MEMSLKFKINKKEYLVTNSSTIYDTNKSRIKIKQVDDYKYLGNIRKGHTKSYE